MFSALTHWFQSLFPRHQSRVVTTEDIQTSGTGHMRSVSEIIERFEKKGYNLNLVPEYDHFSANSGQIQFPLSSICVDSLVRFENASDPQDQAVVYAISSGPHKGVFVEAYGIYQDAVSPQLLAKLQAHHPDETEDK